MASPVNIRVMAPIPFPALVVGSAPIVVSKANGIFTVALDVNDLGAHVPGGADFASEFLIVYDSVRLTYFKVALQNTGFGGVRLQRSVNASPIVVASNDQIINFNINAGSPTCQLPFSPTRQGVPLTFKDAGGHAGAHPLTFTTTGGETMDGIASGGVSLGTNFGEITFRPYNDGTNTGWAIL